MFLPMDRTVIMVYTRQKGPEPLAPLWLLVIKLALNMLTMPHGTVLRLCYCHTVLHRTALHSTPHPVMVDQLRT
jgi:hypothetical protein